ncbi:MAG: four helix bundle protein [Planctomycetaceae bacterium]|nr:four helix bundle protein [Planctomycetaceae bacterium]
MASFAHSSPLVERTKAFALRVIRLVESLPRTRTAEVVGRQLLRSATSVAANYRAAQRGRSRAEFLAKLGIVEEESDESTFWLEILRDSGVIKPQKLELLIAESNEITAIIVASIRAARSRSKAK